MLSVHVIERHFRTRRFEPLLDALAANGQMLPLPLKVRLAEHPVCATAMALRRVMELTYGLTAASRELADFVLDQQEPDGSWHGDPLATAVALAALARVTEATDGDEQREITAMIERGLAALAGMQEPDGLFHAPADRTEEDRALTAAYILYLLTDEHAFREAIRFAELMDYFEQNAARLGFDAERLLQLAMLDVPALAGIGPARSASAA